MAPWPAEGALFPRPRLSYIEPILAMEKFMRTLPAVLLAALLAFGPGLADARPGMGGSMGSRGSHTWSAPPSTAGAPYGASPFTRSFTPNSGYGNPGYRSGGGYGYSRPTFGRGLMGGLLGAGLFGMLLGGGFFGFHGGFGFIGMLLQLLLLFVVGRWLMARFFGAPAMAGAGNFARGTFPPLNQNASQAPRPTGGAFGRPGGQQIAISSADYQQFSQLLQGIQAAWSNHDLNGLQAMATPEMVSYFNEQLSDQASRGVRNRVTDVRLQQGDLSEAWAENGRQYATVSMRFSMIDVTTNAAGQVVDGSPTERITATEFWTFVRAAGGHWLLSAIQQAK
jgi:predicted lipid-binding transport protein (Tim44 family)